MDDNRKGGAIGATIPTVVQIVFIILKLTKLINWSWLWVLSPLWIGAGLWVILFLLIVLVMIITSHKDT